MAYGNKSNDNKSNNINRGKIMIYFVIRKYQYKNSEPNYRIEKHTDNLDEANKFLSALSLLENDEYVSFFITAHQFQEPLVLDSEVA